MYIVFLWLPYNMMTSWHGQVFALTCYWSFVRGTHWSPVHYIQRASNGVIQISGTNVYCWIKIRFVGDLGLNNGVVRHHRNEIWQCDFTIAVIRNLVIISLTLNVITFSAQCHHSMQFRLIKPPNLPGSHYVFLRHQRPQILSTWQLWNNFSYPWLRHQMETFSALLAICAGNSPVIGEFPAQRPVTRNSMFSLICTWINVWANNRNAGVLRRHCAHYDLTVMMCWRKPINADHTDRDTAAIQAFDLSQHRFHLKAVVPLVTLLVELLLLQ